MEILFAFIAGFMFTGLINVVDDGNAKAAVGLTLITVALLALAVVTHLY